VHQLREADLLDESTGFVIVVEDPPVVLVDEDVPGLVELEVAVPRSAPASR